MLRPFLTIRNKIQSFKYLECIKSNYLSSGNICKFASNLLYNELILLKKMSLYFLLLFFLIPVCFCLGTITTNQSITGNYLLLSKEGTFALGFFSPGRSVYKYIGIWYHNLPQKTVVWVANREDPVPRNDSSAVFTLSRDERNLVLYSGQGGKYIWSTNVSSRLGIFSCDAQLLDSGNLILVHTGTEEIIWQSFDYPTDTMLPGMKLGLNHKLGLTWSLTSWLSADDPAVGETSFKIKPASPPQFFLFKGLTPHWRSDPWPIHTRRVAENSSIPEYLYKYNLVNTEDEIYYTYSVNDKSVLTRSVVDNSGLIQRLTWDNSSGQWKQSWFAPRYIYGYCGANSLINSNNVNLFECSCLPGYKPKSSKNWYLRDGSSGCVRKQNETRTLMCRNGEGFVNIGLVKIPDTSIATLMNSIISAIECQQKCLMNCSCNAYAIFDVEREGFGCLMWHGELMDTMEQTDGYDLYVRVDATELAQNQNEGRYFRNKRRILIISVLSAALAIIVLVTILANLWLKKKKINTMKKKGSKEMLSKSKGNEFMESKQPADLPISDIRLVSVATNNFNPANKLGQGGFGTVYKGELVDGQEIAVKRLSKSSGQGIKELKNEVMLIARLQHRNLVKLLGCCIEEDEQMLIYEFMPNKSLDFFIFDEKRRSILDWKKRLDIIVGIARGMLYLHQDSRLRIIHRDLKLSNVLLDSEMNPKISDFGMARIFRGDDVQNMTNRVVGTFGYMAPEYATFGKFSTKSDVFSFGVILLEIISGKKSNNCYEDPSLNLIAHIWELWREDRTTDIIDSFLKGSSLPQEEVVRCIQIGLLCVEENAADRPSMPSVVVMLNSEATLPLPQQPAFIFRKTTNYPTPLVSPVEEIGSINELTITMVESR